jgi:hypothetical protein
MTARPIFLKSQRWPVCATVALMLVMVSVLLAAGCMNQTTTINQTYPPMTTFTNTPAVTSVPVPTISAICPSPANGSYWIMITPIGNMTSGDLVLVNGSTNIPAGGLLNVWLSHPSRQKTAIPTMKGNVSMVKNGNCTNTFALIFDTPELNVGLKGTNMVVEVYSSDVTLPGYNYPANRTEFHLFNQITSS